MVVWNEENVVHLLSRAGFGAKPQEIKGWLARGLERSVASLVYQKGSSAKGPGADDDDPNDLRKLQTWWFKRMATAGSRRLQEKMCLFWHDHFASGVSVVKNNKQMAIQNRTFRLHGMGPFRTLVFEITRDPAMLDFLDGKLNTKNRPNENYGREVMELFVLGVTDLLGVENYTQADVTEIARCLTGWQVTNDVGSFVPARFDGGNKTLFPGKPFQASGNLGVVDASGNLLPPATNVIDVLFTHTDSDTPGRLTMPRFLGKKLWEYFAYPSPSLSLIDEITAPFIATAGQGFVIAELLRAIFTHDEFYGDAAKSSSVKTPCEYAAGALRALKVKTTYEVMPDHLAAMGMELFDPPSVNGWNNGLAWLSSGQLLARFEFAQAVAAGRDPHSFKLIPTQVFDDDATSAADVVDQLTALLQVQNAIPPGARQALIDYFAGASDFHDPTTVETKVRGAIALLLQLPELHLH